MIFGYLFTSQNGLIITRSQFGFQPELCGNVLFRVNQQIAAEATIALNSANAGSVELTRRPDGFLSELTPHDRHLFQSLRKLNLWVSMSYWKVDWHCHMRLSLANWMRHMLVALRRNNFGYMADTKITLNIIFDRRIRRREEDYVECDETGCIYKPFSTKPHKTNFQELCELAESRTNPITQLTTIEIFFSFMQLRELMANVRKEAAKHIPHIEVTSNVEEQVLPSGLWLFVVTPNKMVFCDSKDEDIGVFQYHVPSSTQPMETLEWTAVPSGDDKADALTEFKLQSEEEKADFEKSVENAEVMKKNSALAKRKATLAKKRA